MKIQSINPIVPKVHSSVNIKSTKSVSQPTFNGNYSSVYTLALKQRISDYSEATELFRRLAEAAKTESGLFKGLYFRLLEGNTTEALKDARNSSYYTGDLLTSTAHKYSLVSMNSGEISFNDPEYGSFGSSITFWLSKNGDLNVMRLDDYHKFYAYGNKKEYYLRLKDGSMFNHTYYNRDGSENTLKNFFFT